MTSEPIVYVVDDDEAVRRYLSGLLESIGLAVECYASAGEFLESYEPHRPGCAVVDLRMPGMSGLQLQKKLVDDDTQIQVIFLTGHGDIDVAVQAMKAGAYDFVEKPFNNELLLDRVQKALAVSQHAHVDRAKNAEIEERMKLLTPRELEVLEWLISGQSNKGVARHLGISERTVEVHRANLREKMQAESFAELVAMMTQMGYQGAKG